MRRSTPQNNFPREGDSMRRTNPVEGQSLCVVDAAQAQHQRQHDNALSPPTDVDRSRMLDRSTVPTHTQQGNTLFRSLARILQSSLLTRPVVNSVPGSCMQQPTSCTPPPQPYNPPPTPFYMPCSPSPVYHPIPCPFHFPPTVIPFPPPDFSVPPPPIPPVYNSPPTPVYIPLTHVCILPTPVYYPPTPVYNPPTPVYNPPTLVYRPSPSCRSPSIFDERAPSGLGQSVGMDMGQSAAPSFREIAQGERGGNTSFLPELLDMDDDWADLEREIARETGTIASPKIDDGPREERSTSEDKSSEDAGMPSPTFPTGGVGLVTTDYHIPRTENFGPRYFKPTIESHLFEHSITSYATVGGPVGPIYQPLKSDSSDDEEEEEYLPNPPPQTETDFSYFSAPDQPPTRPYALDDFREFDMWNFPQLVSMPPSSSELGLEEHTTYANVAAKQGPATKTAENQTATRNCTRPASVNRQPPTDPVVRRGKGGRKSRSRN